MMTIIANEHRLDPRGREFRVALVSLLEENRSAAKWDEVCQVRLLAMPSLKRRVKTNRAIGGAVFKKD
jgi:hypothetical protein